MLELDTSISVWELIKHAGRWITNLKRAKDARKSESIAALRKVILAARQTSVYIRHLQRSPVGNPETEGELAMLWTELGFTLEDLGIEKLAKRCNSAGKSWSQLTLSDRHQLQLIVDGLENLEQTAQQILTYDIEQTRKIQ